MFPIKPGRCRVCGCTEDHPCLSTEDGVRVVACAWLDTGRTLCSNVACVGAIPLAALLAMPAANPFGGF
jgi:hypothetical protein